MGLFCGQKNKKQKHESFRGTVLLNYCIKLLYMNWTTMKINALNSNIFIKKKSIAYLDNAKQISRQ